MLSILKINSCDNNIVSNVVFKISGDIVEQETVKNS